MRPFALITLLILIPATSAAQEAVVLRPDRVYDGEALRPRYARP